MGGKTGTAQKLGRDGENYLVSFIGYAPQDNPQLVIYCVVDEPNVQEQSHSTYAQNIVREILKDLFPYMGIYQDEELTGVNNTYTITGAPNSSTSPINQTAAGTTTAEVVQDSAVAEEEGDALPEGENSMPNQGEEQGDGTGE